MAGVVAGMGWQVWGGVGWGRLLESEAAWLLLEGVPDAYLV